MRPPRVELIYDAGCPNVEAARSELLRAFAKLGAPARWLEWERGAAETPLRARRHGSPTILVDRRDVAGGGAAPDASACRVYIGADGTRRAGPPAEWIVAALRTPAPRLPDAGGVAALSALGAGLLPKAACPACLPAVAATLAAVGIEVGNFTPLLLPLTLAFVVVALGFLALCARRTGDRLPLALGVAAAIALLAGRYIWELEWTSYGGAALLAAALLGQRRANRRAKSCPACSAASGPATSRSP